MDRLNKNQVCACVLKKQKNQPNLELLWKQASWTETENWNVAVLQLHNQYGPQFSAGHGISQFTKYVIL